MAGPLRNARYERFVGFLLEGKSELDAYTAAGYTGDRGNASRLKARPEVAARLAEMQEQIAAEVPVTVQGLISELEQARIKASDLKQLSAAIKAIEGKAKLSGLLVERQKVEVSGSVSFDKAETPEDIIALLLDEMIKYGLNDYHDFRPEDRTHLAELFTRRFKEMCDETAAYMDSIKARPYRTSFKPSRSLPNPYSA